MSRELQIGDVVYNHTILDFKKKSAFHCKKKGKKYFISIPGAILQCKKCGNLKFSTLNNIRYNFVSCRNGPCHNQFVDRTGKVYGYLKILEYIDTGDLGSKIKKWKCQCLLCNNICYFSVQSLVCNGWDKCKECAKKIKDKERKKRHIEAHWKRVRKSYRYSAKSRGLRYEFSLDDLKSICSSNCVYCGQEPEYGHLDIPVNSIDRVDNTVGYIKSNCVPACKECNRIKGKGSVDHFLNQIKKIYHHQVSHQSHALNDHPEKEYTQASGNGESPDPGE